MDVAKVAQTTFNYFMRRRKTSVFTVFSGFKNGQLKGLFCADVFSEQRKRSVFTAFRGFFKMWPNLSLNPNASSKPNSRAP